MQESLLESLINAPSTPGEGELSTAAVLKDFFSGTIVETNIDAWDETRANFIAKLKGQNKTAKSLIFFSHLDVVPVKNQKWQSPPFTATKRNGCIYGRGAVDMKGPIAAAATALKKLAISGFKPQGDIVLAGTAGEETDSCGILRMLKTTPEIFENAAGIVVTEPTAMKVITAHKGIFWLAITIRGESAHGSSPHLGSNAVYKMCRLIGELEKLDLGFAPHPSLGSNTISVNTITGGIATNIVPDMCRIEVDIRLLPGQKAESVIATIRSIVERLTLSDPKFNAQFEVIRNVPAFESVSGSVFVKELCGLLNKKPEPINFTTDAPYLSGLRTPIVIIGPGCPGLCHKPDEFIEIDQLRSATDVYAQIIRHFSN